MMQVRKRSTSKGIVVATLSVTLGLAACSSGKSAGGAPTGQGNKKSGAITIAYIQKQGGQQYFIDEANGAKAEASQLGNVKIDVTDVELDSNQAINAMNTMMTQKVDGIAIVVPDQKIGPQVIDMANGAHIPILASDDPIKSGTGQAAPFVGFDSTQMGGSVGKEAGVLYKQAGWTPADTRIINVQKQDLSDCVLRGQGAEAAFRQEVGSNVPQIINEGTDAGVTQAQDKTGAVVTANPHVKHWVVWGCNDESETGAVTALANAGFGANAVIGVGLGAYLTCKDWKAGKQTGNKAALFISGRDVGADAIKVLVDQIRNGKTMPAKTIAKTTMVTPQNWQQAGVSCT